jgi:hypothetical protein
MITLVQTLVRVYFSDTVFRAFVVNPETTGEALTELIRSRYRDLVQRITGVDANNCALFESRNIIRARRYFLDKYLRFHPPFFLTVRRREGD